MRKNCLDYPVEVVSGVFDGGSDTLAKMLREVTGSQWPRILLIAEQNVVSRHPGLGSRIGKWVQNSGVGLAGSPLIMSGGERMKDDSFKSSADIVKAALRAKVGSGDVALVMGGGALLDVAGWALSQVRGGVKAVRLPTTPTAMFDAAFSTYSALNACGVKDALRIATSPAGVVIDPTFARTVLDGVWCAGYASALRNALVSDASLAKMLMRAATQYRERGEETFLEIINAATAVIAKKGTSKFALWGAHRLEAMGDYKLPYGYAVAIGIVIDCNYAVLRGLLSESDGKAITEAMTASGILDCLAHNRHILGQSDLIMLGLDAWRLTNGTGSVVFPSGLGKTPVEEIPDRDTMKQAVNMLK